MIDEFEKSPPMNTSITFIAAHDNSSYVPRDKLRGTLPTLAGGRCINYSDTRHMNRAASFASKEFDSLAIWPSDSFARLKRDCGRDSRLDSASNRKIPYGHFRRSGALSISEKDPKSINI